MKRLKIVQIGAGSGFVISVAKELLSNKIFYDAEFVLVDIDQNRVDAALEVVKELLSKQPNNITLKSSTSSEDVLEGADYVISSCEPNRYNNWYKDLAIPEEFGVYQVKGENGGPGGIIHATRNIIMYSKILEQMERLCPDAWLMNFTNPMSYLCTYFKNYSKIKYLGFCHQVHGSFGVIAEMLGFNPGELEVISAGVNHLNWLFDIRRKGTSSSYMKEFIEQVKSSKYWKERFKGVPEQNFTLKMLETFNMYPIGYDDHIIEYIPFFWNKDEWAQYGVHSLADTYKTMADKKEHVLEVQRLLGKEYDKPPFPADADHPYYAEDPCKVIVALETNTPTYFNSIVIQNNGAVGNLPNDVILDVPAMCVGGKMRSIHVGNLPDGPLEICRRQTVSHEMLSHAVHNRDNSLMVQILSLSPYVTSITQAEKIWEAYKNEFKEYLPKF